MRALFIALCISIACAQNALAARYTFEDSFELNTCGSVSKMTKLVTIEMFSNGSPYATLYDPNNQCPSDKQKRPGLWQVACKYRGLSLWRRTKEEVILEAKRECRF